MFLYKYYVRCYLFCRGAVKCLLVLLTCWNNHILNVEFLSGVESIVPRYCFLWRWFLVIRFLKSQEMLENNVLSGWSKFLILMWQHVKNTFKNLFLLFSIVWKSNNKCTWEEKKTHSVSQMDWKKFTLKSFFFPPVKKNKKWKCGSVSHMELSK